MWGKNQQLQQLEVSCWSSWLEKVKNDGNKISSAFLAVNHQQEGEEEEELVVDSPAVLWVVPALGEASLPLRRGVAASRDLDVL